MAVVALAAAAGLSAPAEAVFAGANGKIVVSTSQAEGFSDDCCDLVSGAVWMVSLRGQAMRLRGADRATFSPFGKRLAYQSVGARDGIVMSRPDGTRRRFLTRGEDSAPAWSPGGRVVAFSRVGGRGDGLYVVEVADGRRKRLLAGPVGELVWSPSGNKLAVATAPFIGSVIPRIRVVDLDGRVREAGSGTHLSWSRAGLTYRRDDGLYLNRSDAEQERLLADGFTPIQSSEGTACPRGYAWSADGSRVAFDRDGQLFVADASGDAPRAIARTGRPPGEFCQEHAVSFSPDGRLVAFGSGWDGLSVVPANGGDKRLLTRVREDRDCECTPWVNAIDWQPRPRSR